MTPDLRIGIFAPNDGITAQDWRTMATATPGAILLQLGAGHQPQDIEYARAAFGQDTRVILRLLDSTYTGKIESSYNYAEVNAQHVRSFYNVYSKGKDAEWLAENPLYVQADNEPMQLRDGNGRGAWALQETDPNTIAPGAWPYQQWAYEVLDYLHSMCADLPFIRWVAAQLALEGVGRDGLIIMDKDAQGRETPRRVLPEWMNALGAKYTSLCDAVACSCYFANWFLIGHGDFGRSYVKFHEWEPDKEVLITEFGGTYYQQGLSTLEIHSLMAHDYPAFVDQLRRQAKDNRVSTAIQFGGARMTGDWSGYEGDAQVATALRGAIQQLKAA